MNLISTTTEPAAKVVIQGALPDVCREEAALFVRVQTVWCVRDLALVIALQLLTAPVESFGWMALITTAAMGPAKAATGHLIIAAQFVLRENLYLEASV